MAADLIDELYGNEAILLPKRNVGRKNGQKIQKESGLSILGADVKSLFPSLKNLETARLAKHAILTSEVNFENWDFLKALRYIYVNCGHNHASRQEYLRNNGLLRHCPKWLGDRSDLISVGGSKTQDPN